MDTMTATRPTTWSAVQAATRNTDTLLGYTCLWRLDGLNIQHRDLAPLMDSRNLGRFLPSAPSPIVGMRRALTAWARDRVEHHTLGLLSDEEEARYDKAPLVETLTHRDKEWAVFALVGKRVKLDVDGIDYSTLLRIKIHKQTGQWMVSLEAEGSMDGTGSASHSDREATVAEELTPYWEQYRALHLSRDLSRMLRDITSASASLNGLLKQGGVYFVPRGREEHLEPCADLIAAISARPGSGQGVFLMLGVPDSTAVRGQLGVQAHREIMADMEELGEEITGLLANKTTRPDTIGERLNQWSKLADKVGLYVEVLGMRREDVEAKLEATRALIAAAYCD